MPAPPAPAPGLPPAASFRSRLVEMPAAGAVGGVRWETEHVPYVPLREHGWHSNGMPEYGEVTYWDKGKREYKKKQVLIMEHTGRPMPSQLRKLGLMHAAPSGPNYDPQQQRQREAGAARGWDELSSCESDDWAQRHDHRTLKQELDDSWNAWVNERGYSGPPRPLLMPGGYPHSAAAGGDAAAGWEDAAGWHRGAAGGDAAAGWEGNVGWHRGAAGDWGTTADHPPAVPDGEWRRGGGAWSSSDELRPGAWGTDRNGAGGSRDAEGENPWGSYAVTGWRHIDWSATAPEPQPRPKPMPPTPPDQQTQGAPPDQQTQGAPKAPSQASASDGEEPVAPPKAAPASAAPATHPVRATPSPTTVVTGQFKAPPLALLAAGAATAPPPVKTPSPAVLIAVKAPPSTKEVVYELVDDDEPALHLQQQTYYALRTKPADQQQPSSSSSPVPKPMPVPKPTPPPPPTTAHPLHQVLVQIVPEPMPPPPPTTAHPRHPVLVQIGPKAPAPALPTDVVVMPPSNLAVVPGICRQDAVRTWIHVHVPGVEAQDIERIKHAFEWAGFDPLALTGLPVQYPLTVTLENGTVETQAWARIPLDGFMEGKPVNVNPEDGNTWPSEVFGVHCTHTCGAVGIMKDRRFKAGGYGDNQYCRMMQYPDNKMSFFDDIIAAHLAENP